MSFKIITIVISVLLLTTTYAFAQFYEDYAKSNFYFSMVDYEISKYKEIVKTPKINKDNAFYSLIKEYEKFVYAMNYYNIDDISDLYCSSNNPYTIVEDNRSNKIKIQEYYKHGFSLRCTEAMTMFEIDYNWLEENYGQSISPEYKKWLAYLKNPIRLEDGGITITKNFLNQQIKLLERFANDYPNFVGIADVVKELNMLKAIKSGDIQLENTIE